MEQQNQPPVPTGKPQRTVKTEQDICSLLGEYTASGFTIREFCEVYELSEGTFYSWIKKHRSGSDAPDKQRGLASQEVIPALSAGEISLFAEVNGIKQYREVPASYLRELLS